MSNSNTIAANIASEIRPFLEKVLHEEKVKFYFSAEGRLYVSGITGNRLHKLIKTALALFKTEKYGRPYIPYCRRNEPGFADEWAKRLGAESFVTC